MWGVEVALKQPFRRAGPTERSQRQLEHVHIVLSGQKNIFEAQKT